VRLVLLVLQALPVQQALKAQRVLQAPQVFLVFQEQEGQQVSPVI
jgi:hypothetical protein